MALICIDVTNTLDEDVNAERDNSKDPCITEMQVAGRSRPQGDKVAVESNTGMLNL